MVSSHQLNSKNNGLVLLLETILRHWNYFLPSVATDGKEMDWNLPLSWNFINFLILVTMVFKEGKLTRSVLPSGMRKVLTWIMRLYLKTAQRVKATTKREGEEKQNKTNQNETKRKETKQNETKRNETEQNKTKQNNNNKNNNKLYLHDYKFYSIAKAYS